MLKNIFDNLAPFVLKKKIPFWIKNGLKNGLLKHLSSNGYLYQYLFTTLVCFNLQGYDECCSFTIKKN